MTPEAFVAAHTAIAAAPLVPEVRLHLATELTPLWEATEAWMEARDIEPPFWAFAWPGSQALARWVLDEPSRVAGLRVLDFAAGGGLAAIAAALSGAAAVEAAEIDLLAHAAIRLNAALNEVAVTAAGGAADDVVGSAGYWDLILAGDVCYEAPMTGHILPWLRALAAGGATVILADPGRAYVPREGLEAVAAYRVPVTRELEDCDEREVILYRLRA